MKSGAVNLKERMDSTLDTREAAMTLFAELKASRNEHQELLFDFSGVEFMSRSFADQFHKERTKLFKECGIECAIKDAGQNIFDMLQAVSRTQQANHREVVRYEFFAFSNMDNLSEYLQAI